MKIPLQRTATTATIATRPKLRCDSKILPIIWKFQK